MENDNPTPDNQPDNQPEAKPNLDVKDRPDGLPDNFKTVAELAASQKAGQAKITELSNQLAEAKKGNAKPDSDPGAGGGGNATPDSSPNMPGAIDWQTVFKEHASPTGLSDDTKATLESVGIAPEMVGTFVAGQNAIKREAENVASTVAGDSATWNKALEWGKANLSESDLDTIDQGMKSGNNVFAKASAELLMAKFKEATGGDTGDTDPPTDDGKPAVPAGDVYHTMADATKAQSDPRYDENSPKFDAEYKKQVDAKLNRSIIKGGNKFIYS